MAARWTDGHLDRSDGFPRADWDAVVSRIEELPEAARDAAWTSSVREWLEATCDTLGGEHRLHESARFFLLSSLPQKSALNLIGFLGQAQTRIVSDLLPGIADADAGKATAIVFADIETYYSYIAYFYPPEGHFSVSGGLRLSGQRHGSDGYGCPHFVVHGTDVLQVERIITHELTHDLVGHLPIPGWLNEGLATTVEDIVMGGPRLHVTPEDLDDHRATWSGGGIQEFWSGAAVHRPDDSSRLTYQLGQMAVKALSHDYERFREFVLAAGSHDAGEAAAQKVYGRGLGGLVEQFLGPGDWAPRPDAWGGAEGDAGA